MVLNLQEELNKQKNSNNKTPNHFENNKELELLKEKIDNIEKDSDYLISINNEKLKKHKESFHSFLGLSQTFLLNLRNLFMALKKNFPLQKHFLINNENSITNASASINSSVSTDLFLKEKILERIENEISKFEYLISSQNTTSTNKINNNSDNNKYYNINYNSFIQNDDLMENDTFNSLLASKEKNKELTDMLNKLELKNKLLEEQLGILKYNYNSELKQKFASVEENRTSLSTSINAIHHISLSNNSERIEKLKSELDLVKEKNDETEATLDYIRKLNKDLETKNNLLEEELVKAKKNIKAANEKLIDYEVLKQKNEGLEKEVKYKKSIITYLENVLKISKSEINKYIYSS